MIASYAIVPVCLVALRKNLPDMERPFRLPFYKPLCLIAFYICNLMLYWSGWDILCKLLISVVIGSALYLVYAIVKKELNKQVPELISSSWLFVYFLGFAVISKLGTYGGGLGKIPEGIDFAVIAIFSVAVFKLSQMTIISKALTEENIVKIIPEFQSKS